MKQIQKYLYWALATLLLGAILALGFWKSGDLPRFFINTPDGTEVVCTYNAQDGNYYVFLPSYARMEDIAVDVPYLQSVTLDGNPLRSGMTCQNFSLDTPYELHYKNTTATLWFCQSANVATMYINTTSGTVDQLHKDQEHQEIASVSVYTPTGELDLLDVYTTVKGRGNATWNLDKKPYSLTLSSEAGLLGMAPGTSWVLLANGNDETNLNNKLVLDLGRKTGLAWTPDSAYVDVYLNGQYNGLYLLTEKVEVSPNRLQLDADAGDFLYTPDLFVRRESLRNPFETQSGRTMEITFPKVLTQPQQDRIHTLADQLEQVLFSGSDLTSVAGFDLDSWVRRYLIDEISGNIDGDLASSYIYYTDNTFFAGPVWDYDVAFGNNTRNQNPHSFIAKIHNKTANDISPYYSALYANPAFHQRMTEIYETEFLPLVQQLLSGGIEELAKEIAPASRLNSLRWKTMYETLRSSQLSPTQTAADIAAYLEARVAFLNRAWLEGTEFSTVQFLFPNQEIYWNISVETGTTLETSLVDLADTLWFCQDTGKTFDPKEPITGDLRLTPPQAPTVTSPVTLEEAEEGLGITYTLCLLTVAFLAGLFLVFAAVETLRWKKERRRSGENSRSKIPS